MDFLVRQRPGRSKSASELFEHVWSLGVALAACNWEPRREAADEGCAEGDQLRPKSEVPKAETRKKAEIRIPRQDGAEGPAPAWARVAQLAGAFKGTPCAPLEVAKSLAFRAPPGIPGAHGVLALPVETTWATHPSAGC
jgi:hypothetical protein